MDITTALLGLLVAGLVVAEVIDYQPPLTVLYLVAALAALTTLYTHSLPMMVALACLAVAVAVQTRRAQVRGRRPPQPPDQT